MSMRGGDFSARTGAVVRFSPSVPSRRAIWSTGVRRESRTISDGARRESDSAMRALAPRLRAIICQSLLWMQEAGRCSTRRRTEDRTRAPSFSSRSRKVDTWAGRKAVRAARGAVPASARMPRRSATLGTDWPGSASSWCGRSPARGAIPLFGSRCLLARSRPVVRGAGSP